MRALPRWAPIIPPWNRWSRLPRRSPGTTSWGLHPCPSNSWNCRCSTPLTKYRRSHWRHSTLVSRDSGGMSSQRGRSFPARFHLMMGPMSGSASCRGRHLLGRPTRLALLTSRYCPHRLDWGSRSPPPHCRHLKCLRARTTASSSLRAVQYLCSLPSSDLLT